MANQRVMGRIRLILLQYICNLAWTVSMAFLFVCVVSGGYYGCSGKFTANGSIFEFKSNVLFIPVCQLTRRSSFDTRHVGGCTELSTQDRALSSNAYNGTNVGGSPIHRTTKVQNKGRGLQVTTRYQMDNTILNTALTTCQQESSTYECTNTESTYGLIETWDTSSVTMLIGGKPPLDWSYVVRCSESIWSGSNYVSFLDDGCGVCVCDMYRMC